MLGALAVVGMAFCYGVGGLLAGRYLSGCGRSWSPSASTAIATLVALPVGRRPGAATTCPAGRRSARSSPSAIPGTALAYLLFFALITGAGAAYASLVTYLVPPIALAYGAIFLGERFGAAAFGGLA